MKTPHNEEYKCYLPQDQGKVPSFRDNHIMLKCTSVYSKGYRIYLVSLTMYSGNWYDPLSLTRMWDFRCTISATHVKGTKDDDIQETGEPAERLLDPIFKVGANNKPQCSFKLEVNSLFWLVNNKLLSFRHTGRTKCVTGNISDSIMTKKSKAVRKPQNIILDIIRVLYLWSSMKKRYNLLMFVLICIF